MVRISGIGGPSTTTRAGKGGARKKTGRSSGGGRSRDRVRVADAASLHERARLMLADLPEVRLERIEEIRDALEKGTYRIDEKRVAARIVCNALAERQWN